MRAGTNQIDSSLFEEISPRTNYSVREELRDSTSRDRETWKLIELLDFLITPLSLDDSSCI